VATSVQTPKSISELVKVLARRGKTAVLVSGVGPSDRPIPGKVIVDLNHINALNEISAQKDRILIGAGVNLGRLSREVTGENGLIRQAASLIGNPLVRNRITLLEALDASSPYFDITTPFVLLDAKVRLQSPTAKRTLSIRDFLEQVTRGLKKGEIPIAVEFARIAPTHRAGFFRVARMGGKGTVSAATRLRLLRNTAIDPEIVVSSLTVVPIRSKAAEKEIAGKTISEATIKSAATKAAEEIGSYAEKINAYEHTLIEIAVARTLRDIAEGAPIQDISGQRL
jgi:CO/xanthine dehydrogenase FAD-binding subunit